MKQVYICDGCGSQFETWDEAYECESSHCGFTSSLEPELRKRFEYSRKKALPDVAFMAVSTYDQESQSEVFTIGEYTLKKTHRSGRFYDEIMDEFHEREEEDRRRWQEWEARRAAEQQQAAEG